MGVTPESWISDESTLMLSYEYPGYSENLGRYETKRNYGFLRNNQGNYILKFYYTFFPNQLFNEVFSQLNKNYKNVGEMVWNDYEKNKRYFLDVKDDVISVMVISIP